MKLHRKKRSDSRENRPWLNSTQQERKQMTEQMRKSGYNGGEGD